LYVFASPPPPTLFKIFPSTGKTFGGVDFHAKGSRLVILGGGRGMSAIILLIFLSYWPVLVAVKMFSLKY